MGIAARLWQNLLAMLSPLHLTREIAQRRQIRPENLDGKIAARTGQHFGNPHLDRLGETRLDAGQACHRLAHILDDEILVAAPFGARLQADEAVGLIGAHRIKSDFVRSDRSEEHTSELQSLMRISYAVFCLK